MHNKKRKEVYIYYGISIFVCLLLIVGLVKVLSTGGEKEKKQQGTSPVKKEKETKQETGVTANPAIRVLLMTTGYSGTVHPSVTLASDAGLKITYGDKTEEISAGQELSMAPDDERFKAGNVRITASDGAGEVQVKSIERGSGTPSYAGTIELRPTAEGIAVINELLLEQYLCKVVPSEMPASYELEALKVQAVCARSYAYRQMAEFGYPEYETHVNDSTDYQVYGNSLPQESSNLAIQETAGQVLKYNGEIAVTYYYSTSCGKTTSLEAWGSASASETGYLQSVSVSGSDGDYEKDLPWYKWRAEIPVTTLSNLIGLNTGTDTGTLQSVEVTKRGPGDIALQITATGDKGSVTVDTENKIRTALGGSGYTITKNDGSSMDSTKLLPSAFITITKSGDQFVIDGGGFGHGIGMSQNGANEMAKHGKNYIDILTLFYPGTAVE